jgi:hypothetical protein
VLLLGQAPVLAGRSCSPTTFALEMVGKAGGIDGWRTNKARATQRYPLKI